MTLKARRSLFYSLILAFFLIGSGAVLYAQGWRIDPKSFKLGKAGGIYLKASPSDGKIYVDGELQKNTSGILDKGVFVDSLFPRQYDVKITRDGYESWTMKLTVYPAKVTKMEHIVLIPEPVAENTATSTSGAWTAGTTIVFRSATGLYGPGNKKIPGRDVVSLSGDGGMLITKDASGNYFLTDFRSGGRTNVTGYLYMNPTASSSAFGKNDPSAFFSSNGRSLYMTDFDTGLTSVMASAPKNTTLRLLAASQNYVAWSIFDRKDGRSHIFWRDRTDGSLKSAADPLSGEIYQSQMQSGNKLIALTSAGEVFRLSLDNPATEKLASGGVHLAISPDDKHVAVIGHRSLEIFLGPDEPGYIRFNIPAPEEVNSLTWTADGYNLLLQRPGEIQIFNIQDGGVNNMTKIADADESAYSSESDKLYYVENGRLLSLQFSR